MHVGPLERVPTVKTTWCPKRALIGLRDASRLFHEHFADVLTSRLGFTRSEAQPTLFVDLARNVFIAVHVDDLIMVGSSPQLYEVVGEMKQYFTMKVTPPLRRVWARGTCVTMMNLGVANHALCGRHVALASARNEDCEDDEELSTEEHRILRRVVGKSQFFAPRKPDIAFATNRLARSLAKPFKIRPHCLDTSLAVSSWYAGFWSQAASAQQSVHDADSLH